MIQSLYYFCNTLIHKGEILEKVVRRLHPNITALAAKMGYDSRATIYRHFDTDNLDDGIILKYAAAIDYSFKEEFPDLIKTLGVSEPSATYIRSRSLEEQVDLWKEMYYEQLAENNRLLQELVGKKGREKR